MTETLLQKRSRELVEYYQKFRDHSDSTPRGGHIMPFNWWDLPNPLDVRWLAYSQNLLEYANGLSNSINRFTHYIHQIECWDEVNKPLNNEQFHDVLIEFVYPLSATTFSFPYAIRSRFIVAVTHLCHQANRAKLGDSWRDTLPEKNLTMNDMEEPCSGWKAFRTLKLKLQTISNQEFRQRTDDYRNSYHHEFPVEIGLGITSLVQRTLHGNDIVYKIGGKAPMTLSYAAAALRAEAEKCYSAFSAFQALISEQIEEIKAYNH